MSNDVADGHNSANTPLSPRPEGEFVDLATQLSEAAQLWAEGSLEDTLNAIAMSAVETAPGAEYAGVSLIRAPHTIMTPAATGGLVRDADAIQAELGEGPCVDALWTKRTVRVDNLATDDRWPAFGLRAVSLGVGSMLAFRLFMGGDSWGALNLYSPTVGAFDAGSEFVGQLFASHASIALAGSQEITKLVTDMSSREVCAMAAGILMERHRIRSDEAHLMLVATAASSRMPIDDVARWLVGPS